MKEQQQIQFDANTEPARMFRAAIIAREKNCPAYWQALEALAKEYGTIQRFLDFLARCGSGPTWYECGFSHLVTYILPRLTDPQCSMLTGKTRAEWLSILA